MPTHLENGFFFLRGVFKPLMSQAVSKDLSLIRSPFWVLMTIKETWTQGLSYKSLKICHKPDIASIENPGDLKSSNRFPCTALQSSMVPLIWHQKNIEPMASAAR